MMGDSTYGADYFCQPGIGVAKNFSAIGGARSAHYQIDNLNEKPEKYFKEICQLIDETISYGQIEEPIDDGCGNQDEEEILDEEIDTGNSCSKEIDDLINENLTSCYAVLLTAFILMYFYFVKKSLFLQKF